jgi:hypothetical protein
VVRVRSAPSPYMRRAIIGSGFLPPSEKPSLYKIELLLPWHAAGMLNSRDEVEVAKALAQNKELARCFAMMCEEMTETILLNETLGVRRRGRWKTSSR